jgi:hypothetical protein
MKAYGRMDIWIHIFLTSALLGQLHAPAALPRGRATGTHWSGGWVGPRAGLDDVENGKFPRVA